MQCDPQHKEGKRRTLTPVSIVSERVWMLVRGELSKHTNDELVDLRDD